MAKYIIPTLNNNLEITDPTIEVIGLINGNPKVTNIDFLTLMYSVEIKLITTSAKFGMILENVQAESLDFNNEGAKMTVQVLTALNEQYLVI